MEITLALQPKGVVSVHCDGTLSHTFSLKDALPQGQDNKMVLSDPVETGKRLFAALFREDTPARQAWDAKPRCILLVAEAEALDAIPWGLMIQSTQIALVDYGS